MNEFVIVGAGLGGSLMATLLGRSGHLVELLERRPDPRSGPVEAGRSINLAISTRGLHALEEIGLREQVLGMAIPLHGRMIHPVRGPLAFQPYGTHGQAINSVSRLGLNQALLGAAEATGRVRLRFLRRCVDLDAESGEVLTVDARNGLGEERHPGTVIGADGAWSAVRGHLQKRERHDFSQTYLTHGYKELRIPPGEDGAHRLERHALHIWPRGGYMMMAMANVDGSFTVTLYLAFEGPESFHWLRTPEDVSRFFARTFPDAVPLLPDLHRDFFANPTGSLVTIRTRPWHHEGSVALLGDAAHAIVPFFGQGANAAFEDCLALSGALTRYSGDCARAFPAYEADRRPHADAIADLAIANFHEMRDKVASPLFRLEKRAEVLLHRLFPDWFVPLYTMISFSRIPYAEARDRAARQSRTIRVIGLGLLLLVLFVSWLAIR
ncbi:MAG TPA: NAD(P)/FAD-dependent oxidoreductase [Gemmatimonadales bacterium]